MPIKPVSGKIKSQDINDNLSYLDAGKRDKSKLIAMVDVNQEIKEAFTGGAVAVVGVNSVDTINLKNNATTPEKTDFARNSKNLFNKEAVTQNELLDPTTGNTTVDNDWVTTEYIDVRVGVTYKRSHLASLVMYDVNYNRLSGTGASSSSATMVTDTKYVRLSVQKKNVSFFQFELGTITTEYESYGLKLTSFDSGVNEVDSSKIASNKIKSIHPVNEYPDEIVELLPNVQNSTVISGVLTNNYATSWHDNISGMKMEVDSAKTMEFRYDLPVYESLTGVQSVGIWIYIENPLSIDFVNFKIGHEGTGYQWSRSAVDFVEGWNLIRWKAAGGFIGEWVALNRLLMQVITNSAATVTVGSIFLERTEKAKILFVEDGAYTSFYLNGYPELKSRGIPTTWALTPGKLGNAGQITESELDGLINEYMSSFSFHSWAAEVHSTMTREEVADNAIKSVRWLQSKGILPKYLYRAAITQNNAPNHEVLKEIVESYSSPSGASSTEVFPFENPYGTPRITLHGLSNLQIDDLFTELKKTHGLAILYTHGIGSGAGTDMSLETWNYFLSKLDTALAEGWIEGVTYEQLRTRYSRPSNGWGINQLVNAT